MLATSTTTSTTFLPASTLQTTWTSQYTRLLPILEHDLQRPKTASTAQPPTTFCPQPTLPTSLDDGSGTKDTTRNQPCSRQIARAICRRNVIKELVDTETVFIRDMRVVLLVYKATATACRGLGDQEIRLIFRNIHDIVAIHTAFISQLKKSVANIYNPGPFQPPILSSDIFVADHNRHPSVEPNEADDRTTSVGSAFKSNIEDIIVALEEYLEQSDLVTQRLTLLQQDRMVQFWLEECRQATKHLTRAWDLGSLLIKPVQRVTRYPILISAILRHTPEDHPDRKDLIEAKHLLDAFLLGINTKRQVPKTSQLITTNKHNTSDTTSSASIFEKSVSRMRAWRHRLTGNTLQINLPRRSSGPLNSQNDTSDASAPRSAPATTSTNPFSPPLNDHRPLLRQQWSQSVPNLLKPPRSSRIYVANATIDEDG